MDEVGSQRFLERLGIFEKKEGKRDRIKKLGELRSYLIKKWG